MEVSAGDCHTIFLLKNKRLHISGKDFNNSQVSKDMRIIKTTSGINFSTLLFSDGTALAIGNNDEKQC